MTKWVCPWLWYMFTFQWRLPLDKSSCQSRKNIFSEYRTSLNWLYKKKKKRMCYPNFIPYWKPCQRPELAHKPEFRYIYLKTSTKWKFSIPILDFPPFLKQEHNHARCFQDASHISFCKWPSNTHTKYLNSILSNSILF